MVLTRSPATGNWEHQGNAGRVDLLLVRDAQQPRQSTRGERLPVRARQAIAGVGENAAKARSCAAHTVALGQCDLRLGTVGARFVRNLCRSLRRITGPALGQKQPKPLIRALCLLPVSPAQGSGSWRSCRAPTRTAVLPQPLGPPSGNAVDHFEAQLWQGLQLHAFMTMITFAFLQARRRKAAGRERRAQLPLRNGANQLSGRRS
jgi:hypothetical protein